MSFRDDVNSGERNEESTKIRGIIRIHKNKLN